MKLGDFDKTGRRKSVPVEGSNFFIEVDTVTCGQPVFRPSLHQKSEIGVTPWGTFIIDNDTMMTTMEGIFAGGDGAGRTPSYRPSPTASRPPYP